MLAGCNLIYRVLGESKHELTLSLLALILLFQLTNFFDLISSCKANFNKYKIMPNKTKKKKEKSGNQRGLICFCLF
jgi:hypothetical protein